MSKKNTKNNNDLFGDEDQSNNNQSASFEAMFLASQDAGKKLNAGDKFEAEILTISKEFVFVSTGTPMDAAIYTSEILDESKQPKFKVGDKITAYVTQIKGGEIFASMKPSGKALAEGLEDAFDMMLPVEGKITEVVNGGVRVNVMGKTAFCPISQIDTKRVENAADYVGKKFEFLITQFENRGKNIIVSRRKLLDQQQSESSAFFMDEHKVGEVLPAVITRLEAFGCFAEIAPGLEGLVHISEVSYSHIQHPSEVVKSGDKFPVKILKMENVDGRLKISLSIKQAQEEPWAIYKNEIKEGTTIEGTVTKCLNFGAFVQIKPGIEGLIPMGEMSYTKRVLKSDDLVKPGEKVLVMIKTVDADSKKVGLSLRDASGDPWALVSQKFPIGSVIEGTIEKKETYGFFVRLEPGVVGLLPKSKYKDDENSASIENKKPGETIKIKVADLSVEDRKISLALPNSEDDQSWREVQKTMNAKSSMGSLGDKFKIQLNSKNSK